MAVDGRAFAFLGSGEFESWHDEVDRWLLGRARPGGHVLVVPAASAPEGAAVFDRWGTEGCAHYARLGRDATVVPIQRRADADRPDVVGLLEGASLVFFSGGNPHALAECLRGSAFWAAAVGYLGRGLALAGCSAGVAFLTETTYDTMVGTLSGELWKPGLGYVPGALFGPHWDVVDGWIPGAGEFILRSVPPEDLFVGLDERTALVGDGRSWTVFGRGRVHLRRAGAWRRHAAGDAFTLPLVP